MVRVPATAGMLIAAAAAFALISCGAGTTRPGDPPPPSIRNDPALKAAAASLRPMLEQSFAGTFAGLELHHEIPLMTIYRLADPRLDAEVTRNAPNVRIAFRDARHSLAEMKAATQQLLDDEEHWRQQGTPISTAAPAVDGSGVQVTTSGDRAELSTALRVRYPTMSFIVREGTVVPPVYTGTPPVYGGTPT